jgi:hypothetical protein
MPRSRLSLQQTDKLASTLSKNRRTHRYRRSRRPRSMDVQAPSGGLKSHTSAAGMPARSTDEDNGVCGCREGGDRGRRRSERHRMSTASAPSEGERTHRHMRCDPHRTLEGKQRQPEQSLAFLCVPSSVRSRSQYTRRSLSGQLPPRRSLRGMNEHSYSMGDDKTGSPDQRHRGCCPQAASQASSDRLDGCPSGAARLRRGYTTAATESSWARLQQLRPDEED